MRRLIGLTAAAFIAALTCSTHGYAADWPTRTVRIVCPFSAGGSADIVARLIAQYLTDTTHQSFVVENRTGNAGMIGSALVARADPDGYTFSIGGMVTHVIAPASRVHPPYDPVKDFTPIAYVGGPPPVFAANPTLGVKSAKQLIAMAKTRTINYGTTGIGSIGNLLGLKLAQEAKIKLRDIPYRGGHKVVAGLLSGNIKLGIASLASVGGLVRAGKLIPLAVSSAKRVPSLPSVPTFKELGYSDVVATVWWEVFAPAHLPTSIAHKMHDLVNQALEVPKIRSRLEHLGMIIEPKSLAGAAQMVIGQNQEWKPIVKAAFAASRRNK